jgi:hypothetical protein
MPDKYFPPKFQELQFHCPYCQVYASQRWLQVLGIASGSSLPTKFKVSQCAHCGEVALWSENGNLVFPQTSSVAMPSPDLPDDCKVFYLEARSVYPHSPRASAALLRLCIQKLMPHLGEKGKDLNEDIGALVKKGLSSLVQQALDICRVVGNNAVHPGEISLEDTPEIASDLFEMINFITEDRITRPSQIQALYNRLPEGALKAIEKRDGKA